ncbi:MAG: TlpA family protein disulfide reductase [Deltaproteobacteria bacterium]|nr:TlpA family protein disulfide reductase [Deltaproteobacteria bacterium]
MMAMTLPPKFREVLLPFLVLGASLVLILVLSRSPSKATLQLVGKAAPPLAFSMAGKEVSLQTFRGRVLLINFWAGWCAPCLEEMPSLKGLEERLGKKLVMLAFHVDDMDPTAEKQFQGATQFPKNLIFRFERRQLGPYHLGVIPISILVDGEGVVRQVYVGPQNWLASNILKDIQEILPP